MPIPNRELSQFGSFLFVDNTTKNIGIATTSIPFVGIGTTNPTSKLHVVGDTLVTGVSTFQNLNVSGIVSSTAYYLNGSPLVDAATESWTSDGTNVFRLNGNVGIGTSTYSNKLTVSGGINASGNINVSGIVTGSRFISTVSTGTAPFTVTSTTEVTNLNASLLRGGIPGSNINSYDIVTLGGTQTLTNKTLTLPTFGGTGTKFNGSTSGTTTLKANATAGSNTLTLPITTGTLVSTGDTGVVTTNMIADLNITNQDVAVSAGISYTKLSLTNSIVNSDISSSAAISVSKLAQSTISGVSLGNTLNSLTAGSFINYSSGSTYNGSSSITVSVAATTANTGNTVVSRNSSGDFTAGTITVTNLTASQTVQAQDFNSTSDLTLKTNVKTIENSLKTVQSLRGVSFDWKEVGNSSYGVIAQELEQVLPELVNTGGYKSVNYNGIVGVLIEAVKELSAEVEELKKKIQ